MNTKFNLLLTGFFCLAVSCTHRTIIEPYDTDDEGRVEAHLRGVIKGMKTKSHNTSFDISDSIGVYCFSRGEFKDQNIPYSYNKKGAFDAVAEPIYMRPIDDFVVFSAYYPFTSNEQMFRSRVPLNLNDQSEENLMKMDILYAGSVNTTIQHPHVNLTFNHVLTKLVFNIHPGMGLTLHDLKDNFVYLTLSGFAYLGDFDPLSGLARLYDGSAKMDNISFGDVSPVVNEEDGSISFSFLMIPQELPSFKAVVSVNGDRYPITIDMPEDEFGAKQIVGGSYYTYNLILDKTTISLEGASISNWIQVDGGEYHVKH